MKELECKVCHHKWFPRQVEPPKRCPNPHCGSANWNREKKGEKEY